MLCHQRRRPAEPFERSASVNPAASVRLPELRVGIDGIARRNPTAAWESSLSAKGIADMAMISADSVIELNATADRSWIEAKLEADAQSVRKLQTTLLSWNP